MIEQALRQERDRAQAYLDVAEVMIIVWILKKKLSSLTVAVVKF